MKDIVIEELRARVPAIIDRELPYALTVNQGRCLPSSRIALDTFSYFGIEAEPLVMGGVSGNASWIAWMGETNGQGEMPDSAWSVGIDTRDTGKGFAGHMVVKVDDHLLDLDARQFARPGRQITVPPTIYEPLDDHGCVTLDLPENGMLMYVNIPKPWPRYHHAPDWKKAGRWSGEVIRAIKGEIDAVHVS